jgi:hypothetical protein
LLNGVKFIYLDQTNSTLKLIQHSILNYRNFIQFPKSCWSKITINWTYSNKNFISKNVTMWTLGLGLIGKRYFTKNKTTTTNLFEFDCNLISLETTAQMSEAYLLLASAFERISVIKFFFLD